MFNQPSLTDIRIPYPTEKDLKMKITAPRCKIVITPGLATVWVTGRYTDEKRIAPLGIGQSKNTVEIVADGPFSYRAPVSYRPELRVSFGRSKTFALNIKAGDLCDHFDFGGLPLSTLELQYEIDEHTIDFSYPTPKALKKLEIMADNGPIILNNLANASPAEIRLNGDSTKYQIRLGGNPTQTMKLYIGLNTAKIDLQAPLTTPLVIRYAYPPKTLNLEGFTLKDKSYWNAPALNQQGPVLYIYNSSVEGTLRIQSPD